MAPCIFSAAFDAPRALPKSRTKAVGRVSPAAENGYWDMVKIILEQEAATPSTAYKNDLTALSETSNVDTPEEWEYS